MNIFLVLFESLFSYFDLQNYYFLYFSSQETALFYDNSRFTWFIYYFVRIWWKYSNMQTIWWISLIFHAPKNTFNFRNIFSQQKLKFERKLNSDKEYLTYCYVNILLIFKNEETNFEANHKEQWIIDKRN